MSDIATGKDADFSEQRLIERYNADLANSLGNLLNRTLNMAHRYRDGRIIDVASAMGGGVGEEVSEYRRRFDRFEIHEGLDAALMRATKCNMTIEMTKPWSLAKKQDDKINVTAIDKLLAHLAESLRVIAILISPVLPKAAHEIFDQLNWKIDLSGKEERFSLADAAWGRLPDGHVVGKPTPLFPRIEILEGV
jgi:methionyl-tRNA synthetase